MILLEKALEIIREATNEIILETEIVEVDKSNGRVLAEDIVSDMDFPSFDKSAMDGYAIKRSDIEKLLEVIEFIPAGKKPEKNISKGQCSKIMTGAMLPEGADMVVKIEDTELIGDKVKIKNLKSKGNILFKGENLKEGDIVLNKACKINPVHTGILASTGVNNPTVFKKPILSVISTGSELVSPEEKPFPPQIRNSNSTQIQSLAYEYGAEVSFMTQVEDDENKILQSVKAALLKSDIVVLTGGASFGDLDFSQKVFESLNAKIKFT
ncbi:MAG: molybdopterin molybdenumtransferase MoeA, partial [Marinilabiliales bacterium]